MAEKAEKGKQMTQMMDELRQLRGTVTKQAWVIEEIKAEHELHESPGSSFQAQGTSLFLKIRRFMSFDTYTVQFDVIATAQKWQ